MFEVGAAFLCEGSHAFFLIFKIELRLEDTTFPANALVQGHLIGPVDGFLGLHGHHERLGCYRLGCLEGHLKKAKREGATAEEIAEVIAIALGVNAAAVVDRSDIANFHLGGLFEKPEGEQD